MNRPASEKAAKGLIGIYGGTFDPVHFAHLRLAEEACGVFDLRHLLWVPAGQPPHRAAPQVSSEQRLEMVRRAIAGNRRFILDATEVENASPSYTVLTLERLRRHYGDDQPLLLLTGADAFALLHGWHRWQDLFGLAHIAVACRPGFRLDALPLSGELQKEWDARYWGEAGRTGHCADEGLLSSLCRMPAGKIVSFPMTPLDISATQIRALFAQGSSARYLLPDSLIDFIENHRLYGAGEAS